MPCKACVDRGKTWEGSDPKCAFETGVFSEDNWNCATVDLIRELVSESKPHPAVDFRWCDDQKYATVQVWDDNLREDIGDALALWLTWYKNRGATDNMLLLTWSGSGRPPTESECLAIAGFHKNN